MSCMRHWLHTPLIGVNSDRDPLVNVIRFTEEMMYNRDLPSEMSSGAPTGRLQTMRDEALAPFPSKKQRWQAHAMGVR